MQACTFLLLFAAVAAMIPSVLCQQDFTTAPVPDPFRVGDYYPPRPEVEVCRPIRDYIDRNSARFTNELVTNTNNDITFSTADSRIMSSRMQSRLNTLAAMYRRDTGRRMTVERAWVPFPSGLGDDMSLHYEGRTVRIRLSRSRDYDTFLQLAVQAAFDWVFYAEAGVIRLSVIPTSCDRNIDCVFMLDQSGSVGEENHAIAINFIENVVNFFTIGLDSTRIGLIAYSRYAYLEFDLDEHTTLNDLQAAIRDVNYRGGSTSTALALNGTRIILNAENGYGARPNSEGVPKIGILLTDGKSNNYPLTYAAPALRGSGVQVYAVGIGNFDEAELQLIASDPDSEHVFLLSSFQDAAGFVDFLSVTTCETPAIIDPGENTTTTVPEDGLDYFQTECSAFSDTVLVELTEINGTSFLYCSAVEANPGPLTENTVRNETLGITRRTCVLPLPQGSKVVYIGVQGQEEQNAFTIIVWDQLFQPNEVFVDVLETDTGNLYDVTENLISTVSKNDFQYSIIGGNSDGVFSIDSSTGWISLAAQSFTELKLYRLTVQAQNENDDCQRARSRVNLQVLSNQITFEGEIVPVSVPEDAPVNEVVTTKSASGGSGGIEYSITAGNEEGKFIIDSTSGAISVVGSLNFEVVMSYSLTIEAESTGGTSITGTATQIINIEDVNESPYFVTVCANSDSGCSFTIAENSQSNSGVGSIVAEDPDLATLANGMLSYRLDESMSTFPFEVDSNGQITTTASLDREDKETYTLTLIVSDGCTGSCSISIETTVFVTVTDVNDNAPSFVQGPTAAQVMENAAVDLVVAQYIAEDIDVGSNAEITYSLSSSSSVPFSLDADTGVLTVSGAIDYEMVQSYTVMIIASNPDGTSSSVTTVIEVLNLNDNSPIFTQNEYSVTIAEHSNITMEVIQVSATDEDLGIAGDVRYNIIASTNFQNSFTIDSQSGVITVAADIDRETVASFDLSVRARDRGTPRNQARVTVIITIMDINDNSPDFLNDPYTAVVREDVGVPFNVLQAVAFDMDERGNPNSDIVYSIISGNVGDAFAIDSSTGRVQVVASLDFETTEMYVITLQASDMGVPSLNDTTTLTIEVTNVNEDPPVLSGDQQVNISEFAQIGSVVAVFNALDPDNNVVTFSISSGNEDNKFNIGSSNGSIVLVGSLDYETTAVYMLVIVASDESQSTNVTFTVNVLDENEFAPMFVGGTSFSVDEEEADGTLVGTVTATDADGDPDNNQVTYSFVQQTSHFMINPNSGEIRTIGVLNREMLTQVFVPPASQLRLDVTARDSASSSRQSTTSITITLVDINDNSPEFSDNITLYETSLQENQPAQTVFQISATDVDLGLNSQIAYSFVLNEHAEDEGLFRINATTGELSTTGPLDCEQQTSYSFTITATDMGTPPLSSAVQGVLYILDENDNPPVFSMSVYERTVSEDFMPMQSLVQVVATDADKDSNGVVRYSIMTTRVVTDTIESVGDDATIFSINETSGVLMHVTSFDFERLSQVNMTVMAHDLGLPRLSSSAVVTFNVLNVDERRPEFESQSCDVFIVEEEPPRSFVTQCEAVDRDTIATPGQHPLTYAIIGGNGADLFEIENITGTIRNSKRIDSDVQSIYSIDIEATDLVGQTVRRTVDISVRDINDNAPVFDSVSYSRHFTDSQIRDYEQDVVTVSANDPDNGFNGSVRYSLREEDVIRVSDKETVVTIVASDRGTPSLSNNTTLKVTFDTDCLLQSYSIDAVSGQVTAFVLCLIEITPPELKANLGSSGSAFFCTVLHNSRMTYQWVHNGSLITPPTLISMDRSQVSYTVANARFEDSGEYACKATTQAGSLQTASRSLSIRVPPTITVPPKDVAVEVGQTATFQCAAVGIPAPTVEWFFGTAEKVSDGMTISVENVDKGGTYVCLVTSEAGTASALAKLIVYEPENVVGIDIPSINNPIETDDGVCHFIDAKEIEGILNGLTSTTVMVTGVDGDNICEQTACLPNPCQNDGTCQLNDEAIGGYVCQCKEGYTGTDCTLDVDECLESPCNSESTCVNIDGGFQCMCLDGSVGHLCQYINKCENPDLCSNDSVCLNILSGDGYICEETPAYMSSLVVSGFMGDQSALDEVIQDYTESLLVMNKNTRKKRQATDTTTSLISSSCDPRFVKSDVQPDVFLLIWVCPENATGPTLNDQAVLCTVLLESGVDTCKPPNGEVMTPPTVPPLTDSTVTVDVILVDNRDEPLSASESSKILEESGAQKELQLATGLAVEIETPPATEGISPAAGTSVNVAIGIVVGVILLVVAVVGGVLTGFFAKKKFLEHKSRQQAKRKHAIAMVEKGTPPAQPAPYSFGDTVRSHPALAPMTSTSSLQNLIDDGASGSDTGDADFTYIGAQ